VRLRQGRLDEALSWARERELSVADDLSYLREFEHVTLVRILLAQSPGTRGDGPLPEAMALLRRLLSSAEEGGRTASVIEILILQAVALQMQHADSSAALVPLERALALAQPEDYVRIFVDEGLPMATLLEAAVKRRIATDYADRLLRASGTGDYSTPAKQELIEPLSARELDVLRLLATDLDGPEIASELVVSLNTVRTHTRNIYTKLDVTNRRAAVRRAEELGLLSRTRNR
jgi:LuxR family maltose regulon positive regulatory protein